MLRRRVAATSARGDEGLRLRGRLRRAARPRRNPALGLFENRRAQQQAAGPAGASPPPRRFAELGVLPHPANIGLQRLGKPIGALLKTRRVIEENEVEPLQRLRDSAVIRAPADDGREALVERGGVRDFLERHVGGDGIGREHEHHRVGFADQRLDTLPPILEGINLGAVD